MFTSTITAFTLLGFVRPSGPDLWAFWVLAGLWIVIASFVWGLVRWLRDPCCVDFVVWNEPSGSYRMVQDLCFKDAYPEAADWHKAVLEIVRDPTREVWVVTHEDGHPSSPA